MSNNVDPIPTKLFGSSKMKIAITGHTRGLGKGLYEQLGALGHEVSGSINWL